MNLISNFIDNFIKIFCNFWLSGSTITNTEYTLATGSSISGTTKICDDEPAKGTTLLTSATALSAAINDVDANTYNYNATQSYIESMNENELNELVDKLVILDEKPKTLTKTLGK
ncbi:MAG: hypothetical protein IJD92_01705 [Bacilli bacterium]|nr:hypothetical protein [Bacilli bacterium]